MSFSPMKSLLISPEVGSALPVYDLFGVDRSRQAELQTFNQSLGNVASQIQVCLSQLLDNSDLELSVDPFDMGGVFDGDGQQIWLMARSGTHADAHAYFSINHAHLYSLAMLFFGGAFPNVVAEGSAGKAPSDSEMRLFQRISNYQLQNMASALGMGDMRWEITSCLPPGTDVLSSLWASQASLEQGENRLSWRIWWKSLGVEEESLHPNENLAEKLHSSLPKVPVHVRVVLCEMRLTLDELSRMQVGDVVAIDLPSVSAGFIGNRRCFSGRIAEQAGNLVYQISAIEEDI